MLNQYSYYSTLQDIFLDNNLTANTLIEGINSASDFVDIISTYIPDGIEDVPKLVELFKKYIIPKCWDSVVDITTCEDFITNHDNFFGNLAEWVVSSEDKYLPILHNWEANKDKLMDKLRTTTEGTSRASDTPEVSGEWDGNDQLSSIASSTTTTTTDSGTIMNQLNDIRKRYRSIMQEWADSFIDRFTMEVLTW